MVRTLELALQRLGLQPREGGAQAQIDLGPSAHGIGL
jgi:hypothetical protein